MGHRTTCTTSTDRHGRRLTVPPSTNGTPPDRADADTLHKVYSALLTRLFLSAAHRKNLQDRGLTDAQIDSRGYCTFTFRYRKLAA